MTFIPQTLLLVLLVAVFTSCGCRGEEAAAGEQGRGAAAGSESRTSGQAAGQRAGGQASTQPASLPASLPAYDGPPIDGKIEVAQSAPPKYALVATLHAPSGGYEFKHKDTVKVGERTVVRFKLVSPGPTEGNIMVLVDHPERVDLGTSPGKTVEMVVTVETRGVTNPGTESWSRAGTVAVPQK